MCYNLSDLINKTVKNFLTSFNLLVEYDVDTQDKIIKDDKDQNKKYEDKYLEEIRKMNKEFQFTEQELELREMKKIDFYTTSINNYTNEIKDTNSKLMFLNKKMTIINTIIEGDVSFKEDEPQLLKKVDQNIQDLAEPQLLKQSANTLHQNVPDLAQPQLLKKVDQNIQDLAEPQLLKQSANTFYQKIPDLAQPFLKVEQDYDNEFIGKTKEECIEYINEETNQLQEMNTRLLAVIETKEGINQLLKLANESADIFIINKHLERLENCFVLETTPHGNVLMIYDNKRGSFKYYSDNTIPYRYLEPVARKYVKQFNCRPLYVDMEEELKLAQEKWEKERKEKEEKEEEEKRRKEESIKTQQPLDEKKNVFAKFKTYNKEAGSGRVNTSAPPKNSIPNNKLTNEQENEKILLKERANRYTYEGKLVNFNFLKKVERKVVDKKYGLSFADFKKMCKNE
jgi:hypothetical protein